MIAENVIKEENIVVLVVMVKVKRDAIIVLERAKIAMVKNVENVRMFAEAATELC